MTNRRPFCIAWRRTRYTLRWSSPCLRYRYSSHYKYAIVVTPPSVVSIAKKGSVVSSVYRVDVAHTRLKVIPYGVRDQSAKCGVHRIFSTEPVVYDLQRVMRHIGSAHRRHYIAHVRDTAEKWYHYNDTKVTTVSANKVLTNGVYI